MFAAKDPGWGVPGPRAGSAVTARPERLPAGRGVRPPPPGRPRGAEPQSRPGGGGSDPRLQPEESPGALQRLHFFQGPPQLQGRKRHKVFVIWRDF